MQKRKKKKKKRHFNLQNFKFTFIAQFSITTKNRIIDLKQLKKIKIKGKRTWHHGVWSIARMVRRKGWEQNEENTGYDFHSDGKQSGSKQMGRGDSRLIGRNIFNQGLQLRHFHMGLVAVTSDRWSVISDHWSLSSSPRIRGPHLLTIFVHFPGQERARPSPFCTHQWSGSKAHDLHDPIIYQCPVNTNSSHHSFHFISFPFLPSPSHLPSVTSSELIIITLYPIPYFFNSLILISFILCIFLPFSSVWAYRRAGPYNQGSCGLLGLVG